MQTQSITLDFCRNEYKTITVKQYDKDSRNLLITCTDNGVVYKLDSSTQECNVKMNTPDNRAIYNAATINEDGKVFITFDENMVYDSGTGQLEIHIIEQSTKRTLSSMILTVIIVGSVYSDDKIIASDEFNALTDALLNIDEAYQKASEAVEAAQEVTDRVEKFEEQAVRAETVREQNEQLRQENTTKAINAANAATTSATQATSSANTAASQAREATTRLEQLERQVEQTETVREQNEQQRKETAVRAENAAIAATSAANVANNAVTKAQEAANRVEQLEDQIEQAESVREQNEQKRQSNTSQAVSASNAAASAANQATSNANKAAQNANTATDRANAAAEACEGVVLGAGLIPVAEKGAAGGVATLDSDGTLTDSQMPSLIYEKSGTTLTLNDSVAGGLKIDRICGWIKQEKTSGNQLFDVSDKVDDWAYKTVDKDDWITVEYDNTSGTSVRYIGANVNPSALIQTGKVYSLVCELKEYNNVASFEPCSRDTSNSKGQFTSSLSQTDIRTVVYKITARDDFSDCLTMLRTVIGIAAGTKGKIVFRLSVLADTSITADTFVYEKFTGNIPSPNPEYKQPIVSAGQKLVDGVVTDVGISKKLTGKNLLDTTCYKASADYYPLVFFDDASVINKGNTYTVSVTLYAPSSTKAYWNETCGFIASKEFVVDAGTNRYSYTFTASSDGGAKIDGKNIMLSKSATGDGIEITATDFQIEEGDTATTYEPYTEQTLTLNHVLRGIQVTDASLANYTDANGQMWCADHIDAERGVLVQRVGEVVYDGSDDEGWALDDNAAIGNRYRTKNSIGWISSDSNNSHRICSMNTNFELGRSGSTWGSPNLYTLTVDHILISLNGTETLDEFKAYLADKPMTLTAILATPIETPLTDEEIIALHQLKTYQGVTHIFGSNDPDATMIFKYSSSEIGGVTLENSNLHAVNEVLMRQLEAKDAELSGQVKELDENISNGMEITDVTQITQGGMYYSNGNVANAPTNDGVYYEYFASKNGWIVSIIARSGSDGATYVSNNGYDGTTWTNKGWHRLITDEDIPYKVVIDDTAGTIDFIDR